MKNILILQHIKIEDPGYIKDLIVFGNFEKNLSFFLFSKKFISRMPISGLLDLTTLPPITSPNN